MRMIFEENIERMDFLEIILSPQEVEKISLKGVVKDFSGGLHGKRDLNVYVRVDPNYEEKEEQEECHLSQKHNKSICLQKNQKLQESSQRRQPKKPTSDFPKK